MRLMLKILLSRLLGTFLAADTSIPVYKVNKSIWFLLVKITKAVSVIIENNNRMSVTSDNDYILAMLLGSSRNNRLEMTWFSVTTTFGTSANPEG